jgi:hypothetical protein
VDAEPLEPEPEPDPPGPGEAVMAMGDLVSAAWAACDARPVGDRTARVTMLASDGPAAALDGVPVGAVPGKGGKDGVELEVGDCRSARTLGGGLKLG